MQISNGKELELKLQSLAGGKILDVATGRGEFIHFLLQTLKSYDRIVGIDILDKSLEIAAAACREYSEVSFRKMDGYQLEFDDAEFDLVSMANSLHHFTKVEEILSEMLRVLRPGGYFLISEMHCDEDQTAAQTTHVLMHHWWAEVDSRLGIVHNPTYNRQEILALTAQIGLASYEIYEYTFPVTNPKDEKLIEPYLKALDPYVDRLQGHRDYSRLKQACSELKIRLQTIGLAPASGLFLIGSK